MRPTPPARRFDPGRRDRIIDVTLEVVAAHGVAGTSHRKIAEAANVPLGSMTYHFTGMDELLTLAFTRLADRFADRFDARLRAAADAEQAQEAVVALITEDLLGSPRDVVLTYELYTLAARDPALREVTRAWMARSRQALQRHFDPATARYLDALIEGLAIHSALDPDPMSIDDITAAISRIIST
ncbi:TetR/AcrR family transcriptional regulator [Streptosporangium sp. NPDC087985]|uniref:TetR/AcrR family transcriptional regulator n=1 Tax=Streptosporangium sp. NPDC087985 TaxID=3366196 RepID=UPI00380B09DC